MSRIESYIPGSFCWAELMTGDVPGAKKFYSEMFGWDPVDSPMPEGVYTLLRAGGDDAGGMFAAQPGMPTAWSVYFSVVSADETAARIPQLGGKLVAGPFDAHDVGRMAVAQDPQGAFFSIFQPYKHIGAQYGGALGRIMWPELMTTDAGAAAAFYTKLFAWGTKPETGIESAQYTEWQNGGQSIGGLMPMHGDHFKGVPPHWGIYITVADCDERAAKATQLGATVCVPPTDIPNVGRFSAIMDPQGAAFNIIQMTAIHAAA